MTAYQEAALIAAARQGDLGAFNQLVLAYQKLVYHQALTLLRDTMLAEDVTQEAFIQAYRKIDQYHGGSFRAWLLRIVTNGSYDEIRRRKRQPAQLLFMLIASVDEGENEPLDWLPSPGNSVEELVERGELRAILRSHLEALPDGYRSVVELVDVLGLNYEETAEALAVPLGTIKSRLARARQLLRRRVLRQPELVPFPGLFQAHFPL